jgi:hypothetical protein
MEMNAYNKLGCGSLANLQTKIDKINSSGLISLSARLLGKLPIVSDARNAAYSETEF